MSTYNPSLLYYKHYYDNIVFGDEAKKPAVETRNAEVFRKHNKTLKNTRFITETLPSIHSVLPTDAENSAYFQTFELVTTYPGLILGTGYAHGSNLLGEFKTGFFFDHTTGMPLIPGSSVKGLLRSAFPGLYYEQVEKFRKEGKAEDEKFWQKLGENRTNFIVALLKEIDYEINVDKDFVKQLEREIFEGLHGTDREKEDHHFPMRDRDIFFDAVIIRSKDQQIFEEDYITPHKQPLKNPIPIQLLKVKPEVTFQFQFRLQSVFHRKDKNAQTRLLEPSQRLELFRQILLFLGAGAKTNTGYGQFAQVNAKASKDKKNEEQTGISNKPAQPKIEPANYEGNITKGLQLEAKVTALSPKKMVKITVRNTEMEVPASGNCPAVGTFCRVTIRDFDKTKKITMVAYAGPIN